MEGNPTLDTQVIDILAESIAADHQVGEITSRLVVRAIKAAHDGDSALAHRLEEVVRGILTASMRPEPAAMGAVRVFELAPGRS